MNFKTKSFKYFSNFSVVSIKLTKVISIYFEQQFLYSSVISIEFSEKFIFFQWILRQKVSIV